MKHIKLFEQFLNEGDMSGQYDGFVIMDTKSKKSYKFPYYKGNSTKIENEALAKLMRVTGASKRELFFTTAIKKGEWDKYEAEVLESANEDLVNEAGDRIPTHLYPSDFDKYFSMYYIDLKQVYMTNTSPRIVMADNGKWYEISATYNRYNDRVVKVKSAKAPK